MSHKTINGISMNEVVKEMREKSRANEFAQYRVDCSNCSLSILTGSHYREANSDLELCVEVAIKEKDFSKFLRVNPYEDEDEYWDSDYAIIHYLPLIGLPFLITQFLNCDEDEIHDKWKGFYLLGY